MIGSSPTEIENSKSQMKSEFEMLSGKAYIFLRNKIVKNS
jgi:hypothetical protein